MAKPTAEQLKRMKEAATGRKEHHSEQWGGSRPGAGRKPTGGTRKCTAALSLSAEAHAKLKRAVELGECTMSEIVKNLIQNNLKASRERQNSYKPC